MKFPVQVVFRNELLRSGKNLPECATKEDLDARIEKCRAEAKKARRFAVWVAIDSRGQETELARGEH